MRKNTKKIVRLTKGEKSLYSLGILCLGLTLAIKVFCGAAISNMKIDIETISYKIETQEKKNQSLTMQVNELTSYENLNSVLKEMGLAYNNDNIIVVK